MFVAEKISTPYFKWPKTGQHSHSPTLSNTHEFFYLKEVTKHTDQGDKSFKNEYYLSCMDKPYVYSSSYKICYT